MEDLVVIARIVKTRGLRGEVVADLLTDFPERFEGLEDVILRPLDGAGRRELKIEKFWFQKGRVILKFAGLDTIEEAEKLRDRDVCVPEDDEFFDWQLEGCRVETIGGNAIGEVTEVMRTGGTEILVVAGDGKEYLVPFAETICTEVDIENKIIRVDPPEGLLDF
jgi:16S rRNA processing protein RimM